MLRGSWCGEVEVYIVLIVHKIAYLFTKRKYEEEMSKFANLMSFDVDKFDRMINFSI